MLQAYAPGAYAAHSTRRHIRSTPAVAHPNPPSLASCHYSTLVWAAAPYVVGGIEKTPCVACLPLYATRYAAVALWAVVRDSRRRSAGIENLPRRVGRQVRRQVECLPSTSTQRHVTDSRVGSHRSKGRRYHNVTNNALPTACRHASAIGEITGGESQGMLIGMPGGKHRHGGVRNIIRRYLPLRTRRAGSTLREDIRLPRCQSHLHTTGKTPPGCRLQAFAEE